MQPAFAELQGVLLSCLNCAAGAQAAGCTQNAGQGCVRCIAAASRAGMALAGGVLMVAAAWQVVCSSQRLLLAGGRAWQVVGAGGDRTPAVADE